MAPPADGGGRHGYGQSGVSADAVLLISTVIVRQMRTGGSWKRLDMAVRMRERARVSRWREEVAGWVSELDSRYAAVVTLVAFAY
jgi:hypothetical protein